MRSSFCQDGEHCLNRTSRQGCDSSSAQSEAGSIRQCCFSDVTTILKTKGLLGPGNAPRLSLSVVLCTFSCMSTLHRAASPCTFVVHWSTSTQDRHEPPAQSANPKSQLLPWERSRKAKDARLDGRRRVAQCWAGVSCMQYR